MNSESVFHYVESQKLENLVTRVLFFLQSQENSDFVTHILEDDKTGKLNLFNVENQKSFSKSKRKGFFDLYFESENQIVLVEIKFNADFTFINGVHQIRKYGEYLESIGDAREKMIIIVGLHYRRDYYLRELKEQLGSKFVDNKIFSKNNVKYYLKYWDNLINFDSSDVIAVQLIKYIKSVYFQIVEMESAKLKEIRNKHVRSVWALLRIIKDTQNFLSERWFSCTPLPDLEYDGDFEIGFYLTKYKTKMWFGLWSDIDDDRSPLILQLVESKVVGLENKHGFFQEIDRNGKKLLGGYFVKYLESNVTVNGLTCGQVIEETYEEIRRTSEI